MTHLSLPWDPSFRTESEDVSASVFYGLGADGTVGANKNSIKIVGQETDLYAQGYFVYDSKKSGAITVSHLRTSKRPIRSAYLVNRAGFVACHQFEFVDKIDVLEQAAPGAAFLLNAPFAADEVWDHLPTEMQEQIIEKKIRFFAIDAYALAKRAGMGNAHQHDHADLLLRDLGPAAARRSDRAHQEVDREDLRQARARGRAPELRGRGSGARAPARDPSAGRGERSIRAVRRSSRSGRPISSRR